MDTKNLSTNEKSWVLNVNKMSILRSECLTGEKSKNKKKLPNFWSLSYVSSGKLNIDKDVQIHGKPYPVDFNDNKDSDTLSVKGECDAIKFAKVMEHVSDMSTLWVDVISVGRLSDITGEQMREIGRAYDVSEGTMAVVHGPDVYTILAACKIVDIYNNKMRGIDNFGKEEMCRILAGGQLLKSTEKSIFNGATGMLLDIKEIREQMIGLRSYIDCCCYAFLDKGPYSYWSRAWTLQEQNMSNKLTYMAVGITTDEIEKKLGGKTLEIKYDKQYIIEYSTEDMRVDHGFDKKSNEFTNIDSVRIKTIITSAKLRLFLEDMIPLMSKIWDYEKIHRTNDELSFRSKIVILSELLTGDDKAIIIEAIRGRKTTRKQMLVHSLANYVRCCSNERESYEAVAVAMDMGEDILGKNKPKAYKILFDAILQSGYAAVIQSGKINAMKKQLLYSMIYKSNDDKKGQYHSEMPIKLTASCTGRGERLRINYDGRMIVRGPLAQIYITVLDEIAGEQEQNNIHTLPVKVLLCKTFTQVKGTLSYEGENNIILREFNGEAHLFEYVLLIASICTKSGTIEAVISVDEKDLEVYRGSIDKYEANELRKYTGPSWLKDKVNERVS
jgi:hypothetical protein